MNGASQPYGPSLDPPSTRLNPASLTSLPDILSSLSALESEETELSSSLTQLLSARQPIIVSLARLQALVPHLDELHAEAILLSERVSSTAQTAHRVGSRVRTLDEEMRRVREASDRVGQIMDLKSSLAALQSAIESQDWESATRHCARAMALPLEVVSGPFAESAVPTSESPLPPAQTLENTREQLLAIFRERFEQASRSRDAAATSRFFKLFPAIGWEAEGLEAYASFVVDLVHVRAPATAKTSSPLYYITSLTALFENIAMIVDQHQPVVEKYYGSGKMTSVIERLLQECDRIVRSLLEGWEEERGMKRKVLSDVANSSFQSYAASPPLRRQASLASGVEEDTLDPREIDKVLVEVAGIVSRWSLLRKFLYERLQEESDADESDPQGNGQDHSLPPEGFQAIESSACRQAFENLLRTYYIPLELWYTRTVIDKTHRMSNSDFTVLPATTTTPDDAFYIFKTVLSRLLSTGSTATLGLMTELLRDVMDREYAGVIKRKLDDVYRSGGAPGGRPEKVERENRQAFIVLLNDLDVSAGHMERLIKDFLASSAILQTFLDPEVPSVGEKISLFLNLVPKYRSTLRSGIEQLFNQLMRPKLRTLITDVYKDVSYVLDEDAYGAAEYQDLVRKRFTKAWESLVEGYKDAFTETNYRLFFGLALDVLVRPWEKFILSMKFTDLGAIRFDRDLRAVTTYLSSQTIFGDAREKFLRLQQISTLLNLDSDEDVDDFYNGSGITWKISLQEARSVSGLKISQ
ncbi:hypothetical protein JAAARDRAFT_56419 [Jaapia argillacea MUCL 33604]|uniref:Conserved oligomeric Golgi complex subunit 4 n=1 Tax=Jaapia argillacea MUCL 33604 TaxID=933084 RepID=A0A067PX52_9AGAM|nr:hypothetical protein JAAARDRAFT_56419 [Jaapia argillacea MUCL 33604]